MTVDAARRRLVALEPIPGRKSLAEEAADRLRELILLGELEPGDPISERELAEALGISRTPLRDAMRLLEIDGLLEYTPTRRPFVADMSLEIVAQNLSVLGALEALAGEQACRNATDEEIEEIGGIRQRMVELSHAGDPLEFFRTDMAFHEAIVAASRNIPLSETHRQYNTRLWRARFISSRRRPDRPRTLRQHGDVYGALAARDAGACAAALRAHLQTTVENIAKARSDNSTKEKT
jgi:GntR family transcriptional regulator, rspAB operon transcriptional repressor